jgi:uncharacterized protein YukE
MAVYEFPALGFDPVVGDPNVVEALHGDVESHASQLADSAEHLGHLHADTWIGHASDAFHEEVKSLPSDLEKAGHAYEEVAAALATYASELNSARAEARRLEQEAEQAGQAHRAALASVQQLMVPSANASDSAQSERMSQLRAAQLHADVAAGDLQAILDRAHALEEDLNSVATAIASRIESAGQSPPYHKPGFLQQAWDSVSGFVREHASAIRQVSSVLKIVSAVAGLLSFIPVVGEFLAPIALISAGVALGLDVLLKLSTGEGSWGSIGLDAALMLLPGAGKLFRMAVEARHGGQVVEGADRLGATLLRVDGPGTARLRMTHEVVHDVASRYGVDLDKVVVNIRKDRVGPSSTSPNQTINLSRTAFETEERLARTLFHERVHVEQLRSGLPYPRDVPAAKPFEDAAWRAELEWWATHPLNPASG